MSTVRLGAPFEYETPSFSAPVTPLYVEMSEDPTLSGAVLREYQSSMSFELTQGDGVKTVEVHSKGAPPQMFRDGMGVVCEGRFGKDGVFESTNLMIKHSEEYRAPKPGQTPQEMYKEMFKTLREDAKS